MGNVVSADRDDAEKTDFGAGTNQTDLSSKIDTSAYLRPTSDIVALMVLEHQAQVHNAMTRASVLTRLALYDGREMNKALGRPLDFKSESTQSRIRNAVEPLVRAMLFSEEAALTDPVKGGPEFTRDFAARALRDDKGRSLRDFDLRTRMFKYPCSYLIYTPSFDALPPEALAQFWERMCDVLGGKEAGTKEFGHLAPQDRRAIAEILSATKKGLPVRFGELR
jgi:hypothetical protein